MQNYSQIRLKQFSPCRHLLKSTGGDGTSNGKLLAHETELLGYLFYFLTGCTRQHLLNEAGQITESSRLTRVFGGFEPHVGAFEPRSEEVDDLGSVLLRQSIDQARIALEVSDPIADFAPALELIKMTGHMSSNWMNSACLL